MTGYEKMMQDEACNDCRRPDCPERSKDVGYCSDQKIIPTREASGFIQKVRSVYGLN